MAKKKKKPESRIPKWIDKLRYSLNDSDPKTIRARYWELLDHNAMLHYQLELMRKEHSKMNRELDPLRLMANAVRHKDWVQADELMSKYLEVCNTEHLRRHNFRPEYKLAIVETYQNTPLGKKQDFLRAHRIQPSHFAEWLRQCREGELGVTPRPRKQKKTELDPPQSETTEAKPSSGFVTYLGEGFEEIK